MTYLYSNAVYPVYRQQTRKDSGRVRSVYDCFLPASDRRKAQTVVRVFDLCENHGVGPFVLPYKVSAANAYLDNLKASHPQTCAICKIGATLLHNFIKHLQAAPRRTLSRSGRATSTSSELTGLISQTCARDQSQREEDSFVKTADCVTRDAPTSTEITRLHHLCDPSSDEAHRECIHPIYTTTNTIIRALALNQITMPFPLHRRLTQAERNRIVNLLATNTNPKKIADDTNCSYHTVMRIKRNIRLFDSHTPPIEKRQGRPPKLNDTILEVSLL